MKLSDLHNGETAYVSYLTGSPAFRRRLEEMGFVSGQEVTRLYAAPLGTPIVFGMRGQKVALRRREAALVVSNGNAGEAVEQGRLYEENERIVPDILPFRAEQCRGNCVGCSSCGSYKPQQKAADVENGSKGITIALAGNPNCGKTAFFNAVSGGHERTGNYAGVTVSCVEGYTVFEGTPLRIIDLPGTYSLKAFSPEEAYVANELTKGNVDVIVNVLDATNLERNLLLTLQLKEMGLPIVGALNMYDEFEQGESYLDIAELSERLGIPLVPTVASQGRGIEEVLRQVKKYARTAQDEESVAVRRKASQDGAVKARKSSPAENHATIHRLLNNIYTCNDTQAARLSARIDKWLARSPLSYLLFFALMGLVFYLTFAIGQYPMDWMETGIDVLKNIVSANVGAGWWRDLLTEGILGGVGSVIVFLPNILILYFLISILEDSGYLARAALLADPLLRRVGLHGKSFIPMLMGFGCNVPAVMATRTIESRKSRLITMMTLPFMSCSARLPVYVVFAGAFFPEHAALVMLALYAGGILTGFLGAGLLSHVFRRSEESHFVMEMPPYRCPIWQSVCRHTWEKGRQYLRKMGGIILVASIIVWALGYFPMNDENLTSAERQEQSYMGQIGHAISPVIEPLGYDWRMGVGIISGVGAKELMVSTLGVLYHTPETDDGEMTDASLTAAVRASGTSPAAGLSYLVFALLYFPCLATIAAIKGESGSWSYALFTVVYTTVIAYILAFAVYHIAQL